jgi:hypothetical protein
VVTVVVAGVVVGVVVGGGVVVAVVTGEAGLVLTGIVTVGSVAGTAVSDADAVAVAGMVRAVSVVSTTEVSGRTVDTACVFDVDASSANGSVIGGSVCSDAIAVTLNQPGPVVMPNAAPTIRARATRVRVKLAGCAAATVSRPAFCDVGDDLVKHRLARLGRR